MTIWYKRFPGDALTGMADLDPYERGVYGTILDILYDKGGCYAHDPARMAKRCGATTRKYNIVEKKLVDEGKLIILDGYIFNKRVLSQLKAEFISDLSLNYLVLILPNYKEIKDLKCVKILDSRIQKKLNKNFGGKGVPDLTIVPTGDDGDGGGLSLRAAVVAAHGESVWASWFSMGCIEGNIFYPKTRFALSRIENNYFPALIAAGFTLGEPKEASA